MKFAFISHAKNNWWFCPFVFLTETESKTNIWNSERTPYCNRRSAQEWGWQESHGFCSKSVGMRTDIAGILTVVGILRGWNLFALKIHAHTQPFYCSLDLVLDNPGEPVPEGTFCHLLDFLEQNEGNTSRHTNNLDGLPPHPDSLVPPPLPSPPFLCRMPFLTQPSQFILAWDRHQIC